MRFRVYSIERSGYEVLDEFQGKPVLVNGRLSRTHVELCDVKLCVDRDETEEKDVLPGLGGNILLIGLDPDDAKQFRLNGFYEIEFAEVSEYPVPSPEQMA